MTDEDRRNLELIRDHLTDTFAAPTDEQCISHALRKTAQGFKGQPTPRHPHTIKE